jgi:hypothetical protein
MFILPPNCIVPSATSLTMSPVFPNFRYFIGHTPSAANKESRFQTRIGSIHLEEPAATWICSAMQFDHFMARLRTLRMEFLREIVANWVRVSSLSQSLAGCGIIVEHEYLPGLAITGIRQLR